MLAAVLLLLLGEPKCVERIVASRAVYYVEVGCGEIAPGERFFVMVPRVERPRFLRIFRMKKPAIDVKVQRVLER